jgi:hypothetical protein
MYRYRYILIQKKMTSTGTVIGNSRNFTRNLVPVFGIGTGNKNASKQFFPSTVYRIPVTFFAYFQTALVKSVPVPVPVPATQCLNIPVL